MVAFSASEVDCASNLITSGTILYSKMGSTWVCTCIVSWINACWLNSTPSTICLTESSWRAYQNKGRSALKANFRSIGETFSIEASFCWSTRIPTKHSWYIKMKRKKKVLKAARALTWGILHCFMHKAGILNMSVNAMFIYLCRIVALLNSWQQFKINCHCYSYCKHKT